jgi:2-oxoglutarate dehydrogenase E1 component
VSSLGFNTGYIEELYRQYLENPDSVSESWRDFFADYRPSEAFLAATEARPSAPPPPERVVVKAPQESGDGAVPQPVTPASAPEPSEPDTEIEVIRGPQARIVENMEASLGVPTATSIRTIPVKLMSENRRLINAYQRYLGGEKVSFTHLIAWAVVTALRAFPNLNTTFRHEDGTPQHVIPKQVNLGLAIDIERRGKRTLLVPNIKAADRMSFAQLLGIYNDIVKRARDGKLEISDFEGTTATLTNPGMIGTTMSVARLMPGQGVIIGAGSIGYPPEYHAYPPGSVSRVGISEVMAISSTYDHRVIQGAESGAFLSYIGELFLGQHDFYQEIFEHLSIPYQPYSLSTDSTPQLGSIEQGDEMDMVHKQARVLQFIRAYRVRGHLQADVNPLGYSWMYHPELDPSQYGLTIWDLDRKFVTGGLSGKDELPLREIIGIVRDTYSRKIGVEYMHISDPTEKRWLQERIEPVRCEEPIAPEAKRRVLQKLNAAEAFERFIHTKYIGHKRFSLEGAESVIPMIDLMLSDAGEQEVEEVVVGMAHRGRLNVLANILNKPYEAIFSEFEGNIDPNTTQGSGDVKYHLGARGEHESPTGAKVKLTLASNPSHLEAVNPVVEGMVRARQELLRNRNQGAPQGDYLDVVIPLLIHGDAAFAGQGVVTETLNLSQLRGYKTGGTIHVIINNQIGFTTTPSDARSSTYATDVARTIQAPIFHVNGDDPEACVRVARLALDYRNVFNKDVVIDMLCYRVHGHNEGDEPTYTQPLLYKKIEEKRSPRKLYTETLLRRGEMDPDEAETMLDDYRERLQEAFERTKELDSSEAIERFDLLQKRKSETPELQEVDTKAEEKDLEDTVRALVNLPEDLNVHKKLIRQFQRREKLYFEEKKIDWAFAEALAFGSLLLEQTTVRLSGQDSRRATFSQRHAVLYDQETGEEYIPLNNIRDEQARLLIYDSLLSEYAVAGFEYGYSVGDPSALVLWEAQFGDFANGAQIVFDQFLSAAEEKWGQRSSLVLLLPHGYEGQGPEHSSARLERFLQMCAEDNMIVCNFTTPANYFHALRRQTHRDVRKPLVIMVPKSLLRHPKVISGPDDFTQGAFQKVIPSDREAGGVERHLLCSGKIYYDLAERLEETEGKVAVTRLEQFYPFPKEDVLAQLERYAGAGEVCWVQEEPANMGAWTFLRNQLDDLLEEIHGDCDHRVQYVGRRSSASTATGSARVHQSEQEKIVGRALGLT